MVGLVALGLLAVSATAADWPEFLPPPETLAPDEVSAIRKVWTAPTLHRRVSGPPAPMPLPSYLALIDSPELTAAAVRHLGVGHYDVREIGPDWYAADDHDGSRGVYHMLVRGDGRRVTLSWGSRQSALLGTVSGSALTVLTFAAEGDRTLQQLDTYVVIDNTVAAGLARALVAVFGHIADRKLAHGFEMTAKVAAWARERPDQFCAWLVAQPLHTSSQLCSEEDHPVASLAR